MKTRTRTKVAEAEETSLFLNDEEGSVALEALSDEELQDLLFEDEIEKKQTGFFNLPTMAGLSLISVGMVYILQEMGVNILEGINMSEIVGALPFIAGILIILLGFGVLSWRPSKRKKKAKVKKAVTIENAQGEEQKVVVEKKTSRRSGDRKRRLSKSHDKKISGVAGGLAEYFNLDPTLVRIALVIGTIATQGSFILGYLILSFVMPKSETKLTREERITIIRDS